MTYTDAEIEAAARAIALADSIEYIKATSDASELGHASDSGWADWMPHARSALSAVPREPEGWRLIETAPRDGTRFIAAFITKQVAIIKRHDPSGTYETWVTDSGYPNLPTATHWMPLPAAPRYGEGK